MTVTRTRQALSGVALLACTALAGTLAPGAATAAPARDGGERLTGRQSPRLIYPSGPSRSRLS